jgi:hypothetical protein
VGGAICPFFRMFFKECLKNFCDSHLFVEDEQKVFRYSGKRNNSGKISAISAREWLLSSLSNLSESFGENAQQLSNM